MLTIEIISENQLEIVRKLAMQIFPETYANILSPEQINYMMNMMYSIESLHHQVDTEKQIFHLIKHNNIYCGYFSLEFREQGLCILQKLYLLPSLQGKGIGKQALDKAITYIKCNMPKTERLQLFVNRENKAKDFYLKYGFSIIDSRDFNIGNAYYMNDYIMEICL